MYIAEEICISKIESFIDKKEDIYQKKNIYREKKTFTSLEIYLTKKRIFIVI